VADPVVEAQRRSALCWHIDFSCAKKQIRAYETPTDFRFYHSLRAVKVLLAALRSTDCGTDLESNHCQHDHTSDA
jgi:hypothetical protein